MVFFFRLVKCERGAEIYQVISDFVKLSGRRGYAGKEVLKSNLCTAIFHKESVVCTLKCHRSSLFIGHFHFCPVFEGATVFRQRCVDSYCLGQVSEIPVGWSMTSRSLGGCTKYKTGVKFFLKTSLMQVNQRCAASSGEEKLHVTPTHESRQRTIL